MLILVDSLKVEKSYEKSVERVCEYPNGYAHTKRKEASYKYDNAHLKIQVR